MECSATPAVDSVGCPCSIASTLAIPALANSDHHLWKNRRRFWIAFVVIRDGYRQERIRRSLGTENIAVARRRRDALLREWSTQSNCVLSLRFDPSLRAPLQTAVQLTLGPRPRRRSIEWSAR